MKKLILLAAVLMLLAACEERYPLSGRVLKKWHRVIRTENKIGDISVPTYTKRYYVEIENDQKRTTIRVGSALWSDIEEGDWCTFDSGYEATCEESMPKGKTSWKTIGADGHRKT